VKVQRRSESKGDCMNTWREEDREGCSTLGAFSIVAFAERRWNTSVCTNIKWVGLKLSFL